MLVYLLDYPYLKLVYGRSPNLCIYNAYVQNEKKEHCSDNSYIRYFIHELH
jgi:hypothetical protein